VIGTLSDWLRHKKLNNPGRRGEDLAHRYLRRRGYTIVGRNHRLGSGDAEADIIAWHQGDLVIVEVKTRESGDFGPPERAISEHKRETLHRVAREYARRASAPWDRIRFDLVTVILHPREIRVIQAAIPRK
jgi:putative endonuclease